MKADHGYWGAALIEPYVSPAVTFAVRYHQALRFFPDAMSAIISYPLSRSVRHGLRATALHSRSVSICARPQMVRLGAERDNQRPLCIQSRHQSEHRRLPRDHRSTFTHPPEGLGYDNTAAAHMWRSMAIPTHHCSS